MVSKKIRRLVYELSQNSRIKTKDLGKKIKTSQQSASYLISSLKSRKVILGYNTIIDPAKFGFISILVYYNFEDFSARNINEIISFLKNNDSVVNIKQLSQGYDLACVFCVPNLSNFNKINRDFLQNFKKKVFVAEIFPIMVKHMYPKSYLVLRRCSDEMIICGDRDVAEMSEREKRIAGLLHKNASLKILDIAKKLKLNPKTITKLKKRLEDKRIIRGYSIIWNYKSLGINRKQILIDSKDLSLKDDRKLLDFAKAHPNITSFTRLIGGHDLLIEAEGENLTQRDVLKELRSEFEIKRFRVLEEDVILKDKFIPSMVFN
ncbi:hypothetical protein B6U80_01560 [Candidatus Pacearchaeota archaeon ex4484_26]|nr:MAG: hypothetical protein B6U80_01560 [Candidatus Pacearchaeota archaeon ex4484_26]